MDSEDDESAEDEFDDSEEEEWWREDDSEYDSEDLDREEEIQEHEFTPSGDANQTLKIRLFLTDEDEGEFKWMKNFVAECTCDGVTVATALARYIDRGSIRSRFWEEMEEPSEETCSVAFHVFDRYGTVQTKYKDHPVQRGTGVWGKELDDGPLFLIEKVYVTALKLRRKGLGRRMVSLLLEKARQYSLDDKSHNEDADSFVGSDEPCEQAWTLHALVSPGILTADVESQLRGKSAEERLNMRAQVQSAAIEFWRSCGFRRIGASRCFAYSFDPQHQSRALAVASDFDPDRSHAEELENEEMEVISETDRFAPVKKLKMDRLRDALPLHHAVLTLKDEALKAFFVTYANDEMGWDRVNNTRSTLLHLTACELKPSSTRWLLDNVHLADSWKTARDINGYTPLEALQDKLETMRTQKEDMFRTLNISDGFKGYPEAAVSCLSLLSGQDASGLDKARLQYGCTCGECLGGFLSARMSRSLIVQGETLYDLIRQDIGRGNLWIDDNDYILIYLDHDVRRNLKTNKSLRKGFRKLFKIAAECLKAGRVPTAENLEWCCDNSERPLHTKNYLLDAGTQMGCRAVLRYMFDAARSQDEKAGDGECQLGLKNDWSGLLSCRNDHEFEFVAWACGYGRDDFI
jgi:hypothetical protein